MIMMIMIMMTEHGSIPSTAQKPRSASRSTGPQSAASEGRIGGSAGDSIEKINPIWGQGKLTRMEGQDVNQIYSI